MADTKPLSIPVMNNCTPLNADDIQTQLNSTEKLVGFQPGNAHGSSGRPKGSKNKLSTVFTDDLYHEWERRGNQAIRDLSSAELVRTCVAILPKDVLLQLGDSDTMRWVINAGPRLSNDDWVDGLDT